MENAPIVKNTENGAKSRDDIVALKLLNISHLSVIPLVEFMAYQS